MVRSPALVQIVPTWAPMQFNTALGFVLCGAALMLLAAGRARLASALGAVVTVFTTLTLAQYFFDVNLGVDTALFTPWTTVKTSHPGRMSPLSAICFLVTGLGLLCASVVKAERRHPLWLGLPGAFVGVLAFVACFGYLAQIEGAFSWGQLTRMAIATAAGFLLVGAGLLARAWVDHRAAGTRPLWLPLSLGLVFIGLISALSFSALAGLSTAADDRRDSHEALLELGALQANLTEVAMGSRGFVITGHEDWLVQHVRATNAVPHQLLQLRQVVAKNVAQHSTLAELDSAARRLTDWYRAQAETRRASGFDAARRLVETGEGERRLAEVMGLADRLVKEKQRFLEERDRAVRSGSRDTRVLLLAGGLGAFLLVGAAGWMIRGEMVRRAQAEATLRHTATLQRAILDSANYAIISTDPEGLVTTFNRGAEQMLGYRAAAVVGQTSPALWHDPAEVVQRAEELTRELGRPVAPGFEVFVAKSRLGLVEETEWTFIRQDGRRYPVLLSVTALREADGNITGFLGVIADITARKRAEQALRDSLAEKEILLKEIHHRVKNNMQVISSILNLQAGYVEDARARALFADCQGRVQSMAMIHEKLYRSANLATLDFGQHVRELAQGMVSSFGEVAERVRLQIEAEAVALDIDSAIPVGLILNELVTNALKYAFPGGRAGTLRIALRLDGPEQILLSVADDGIGLPEGLEVGRSRSLGLKMIHSLTRQIGGQVEIRRGTGVEFRIRFPLPATAGTEVKAP